jgi:hypothetical protein
MITIPSSSQTIKPKSIYAKQKTFEIGGDIFLTSTEYKSEASYPMYTSSDETVLYFAVNVSAGVFVINGLKLGVEPVIAFQSYDNGNQTSLKLYFTPEYIFDLKTNVYPFIGGSVGYTSTSFSNSYNSSTESGFSWGAKGGLKVNAFGNSLINLGISYYSEAYNYNNTYGEVKRQNNILGFKGGLSLFFR